MASKSILGQDSAYPLEQVRSIHRAMLLEELRDALRRTVGVVNPNRQGLKTFEQQPGVEGA